MNIIFVGGIHGVGKTSVCKTLCEQFELQYLSASSLIKWSSITSDPNNKRVRDIDSTQDTLIAALEHYADSQDTYLLDGHYCLFDMNGEIQRVPFATFGQMPLSLLCLVTDKPERIKERLELRDGKSYEINDIATMQKLEVTYATEIAQKLNIPLHIDIDDIQLGIKSYKLSL